MENIGNETHKKSIPCESKSDWRRRVATTITNQDT